MSVNNIIETGTYVGNSSTQSIIIGWQPALVMTIKATTGGGPSTRCWSFKFASMPGAEFCECADEAKMTVADGITITSTGFDLGSDGVINDSAITYHWIAVRAGPWIDTGTYTGDGGSSNAIALGRQPSYLMTCGAANSIFRMNLKHGDETGTHAEFATATTIQTSGLTLTSTGFTATAALLTNENTEVYHFCAIYEQVGANRHWELGSWTGDGSAPQTVTTGRQPKVIVAFGITGNDDMWVFKTDTLPGDDYGALANAYLFDDAGGPTLTATGFTVGADQNVQDTVYRYIAGYH